jgi:hypothetical protein
MRIVENPKTITFPKFKKGGYTMGDVKTERHMFIIYNA